MFRWAALVSAIVLIIAVAGAIVSSQPPSDPTNQQATEKNQKEQSQKEHNIALWDSWFPDPISMYTLFLVVFTGILAIGGVYQLNILIRAERTAIAAATAATKSADAAVSAFNLAKRPELTSNFDSWIIQHFGVDQSPIITFEITNVGNSHAHILRSRYEYEIAKVLPETFVTRGMIDRMPALLGPSSKSGPLVIYGLPTIKSDVYQLIEAGDLFLFLRATIIYQDIFLGVVEIRFTGRYGRTINSKGESEFRFLFPDAEVPPSEWWINFRETRRLNFIEGIEPKDREKYEDGSK